jgi:hypothetical protein
MNMATETDVEREEREAQERLAASLTMPIPSPQSNAPHSLPSEMEALRDLLATVAQRVDQVARTSAEQFARMEATLNSMNATMDLARAMIAQSDQQIQTLVDLNGRVETVSAALVRVQANLTEIVVALLSPTPKG